MNKEHVLEEIRRTAKANGGGALGHRKFASETGITWADWHGKFWVRWSDAVKEAGLETSAFTGAYDEEYLLKRLVELTRELGHVPVHGELRIKARNDPTFPSDRPFRRLGPKAGWVSKLLTYAQKSTGCGDVVDILSSHAAKANAATAESEASGHDSDQGVVGFVYMLRAGRNFKIGKTNAVGRRERELAIQLPERADTVHVIKTDDPSGIEVYWHRRFRDRRRNGEWFDLRPEDVRAFKRRKFM